MRFCFLTTFFPPKHFGGDAVFVAKLANLLASRGHEVHVVHCEDSFDLLAGPVKPSAFPLHPTIKVYPLQLGAISPVVTYFTGQPGPKAARIEEILVIGFDVVHWHNLSLIGGPGALPMGRGVRLCTFHDYWFICPTHILFKYEKEACQTRNCLACVLAHHRPPQPWRWTHFLRDSLQHVDRFISPSEFVRRRYLESPLEIDSVVLPHFVDAGPEPDPSAPPPADPYYLFVGRLEKAKGLQTVLPLFQGTKRRLLVAGAGNHEAELRRLASEGHNIEFLGRVPHDRLAQLYAGARATLIPSICYETFGMTILESVRSGTPVVASQFGALPEIVSDLGGGWNYSSLPELAQILDRIDADPAIARARGLQARQQLDRYSENLHLQRYFQIIEQARQ